MSSIFSDFKQAHSSYNGWLLASTVVPTAPSSEPDRLQSFYYSTNGSSVFSDVHEELVRQMRGSMRLHQTEINVWVDIYSALWKVVGEILAIEETRPSSGWNRVYEEWKTFTQALIKAYSAGDLESWTIPCLYTAGKYLRAFAIKADENSSPNGSVTFNEGLQDDIVGGVGKQDRLVDAAQVLNRIFTICMNDRSPINESRKVGIYYAANLIFKTYFKLNSISLCKSIIKLIDASKKDMPDLFDYPTSHVVTFKYYLGVLNFLEENYAEAEEHLTQAWQLCHRRAQKNRELILTYLVPCHLITTHTLPTRELLRPFPRLENLFRPLAQCVQKGDLAGFDAALARGENEFVKRRVYLTLERGRDIATRTLFRKVFLAGGYEEAKGNAAPTRRTRIPVAEFAAAMRMGDHMEASAKIDMDDVECLLANLIYKGYMKGYISRERSTVVLSKSGAFPGTGV